MTKWPSELFHVCEMGKVAEPGIFLPRKDLSNPIIYCKWLDELHELFFYNGELYVYDKRRTLSEIGIFFPSPQIFVDYTNIFNPNKEYEKTGYIYKDHNSTFIKAKRGDGRFEDPVFVPIWNGGSEDTSFQESVGFKNWSFVVSHNDETYTIFEFNSA